MSGGQGSTDTGKPERDFSNLAIRKPRGSSQGGPGRATFCAIDIIAPVKSNILDDGLFETICHGINKDGFYDGSGSHPHAVPSLL